MTTDDGVLHPESVKEALYASASVANVVTGNFRLAKRGRGAELAVQLRTGKQLPATIEDDLLAALAGFSDVRPAVRFFAYDAFPYNVGVDWERKFAYLEPRSGVSD